MHAVASMVVLSRATWHSGVPSLTPWHYWHGARGVTRIAAGQHKIVSLAKLRICGRIASREKPELVAGKLRRGGCSSSDDGRSRQ